MVGLGVAAAAFIAFALAASFLFPRFNPQFPGGGLSAFIVVAFVFFFGMLAAVEVFGAESGHAEEAAAETSTGGEQPTTVQQTSTQQQTTTTSQSTSTAKTTTAAQAQSVAVSEIEFKIAMPSTLKAGKFTFDVKNDGKIPHDLAIKGGAKTALIQPGASAKLVTTLKAGKYTFYCTVPGHEQAGMKVDVTVS
jgi:uncharacterized cupredoxin-like copper-binding protein